MDHYFTNNQNLKSDIKNISFSIFDKDYSLYTDNGVFSKSSLDFGTRLLLESLPIKEFNGRALDVGCGYGPIGLTVKNETNCEMEMVDVNLRAIHLAKMSASKYKLDVKIYESDAYSNVSGKFRYILTNPPIRAGKKKVYEILIGAHNFMEDDGELWFVMRKDQGVKSTLSELEKYYNLSIKSKKKGFFVVKATKDLKNVDNAWFVW